MKYLWPLLLLWLCIIYSPVLLAPKVVNPDSSLILPLFENFDGLWGYLKALFNLQTYDVQPVRDLSLFIDWSIYRSTKINTALFQNILWWWVASVFVFKTLMEIKPTLQKNYLWGITVLFSVYPLFASSLNWGIARKHILAFMFIMMATYYFLKHKNSWKMHLFYALSVFSQPITILWPLWVNVSLFLESRQSLKTQIKLLPTYLIFLTGFFSNYIYYKYSPVFKMSFGSKTSEPFNLVDKFLGLGHYFFQTVFPYLPANSYKLDHWSVLAGLVFCLFFIGFSFKFFPKRSWLLQWGTFFIFPLLVVLVQPHFLSDTYLLTSAFGLLMLILGFDWEKLNVKKPVIITVFSITFFVWSFFTYSDSRLWTDQIAFQKTRNFDRRPSCDSAIIYASKILSLEGTFPQDVREFMQKNDCTNVSYSNPALYNRVQVMQTQMIYHAPKFSPETKIEMLKGMAETSLYSKLVLASLYAQNEKRSELNVHLNQLKEIYPTLSWPQYVDRRIVPLHEFCQKNQMQDCLTITSHYVSETESPFF